ncbi:MAG: hypothetical protein F6J90_24795 [Moorea sp. SIOASIH]|uniref:hypothetical protein n=1 Tax=Moorena sp. SIOASIH TaxID=2607817 RepID=UPI0013B96304|nr:hypothetical protein [Moorena sp. SIOASIH]NEO39377.1 hypothetical protein [Moorena sp. SIOASIH]
MVKGVGSRESGVGSRESGVGKEREVWEVWGGWGDGEMGRWIDGEMLTRVGFLKRRYVYYV